MLGVVSDTPELLQDGRYALLRKLGEGSQGETFEALDKRDGRLVAVKRFMVRGAKSWKDVELAEREARVLSQLSHPALPIYVDHFEEHGALYLVMERLEGDSLAALHKRGARLDETRVLAFLHQASDALDYLHSRSPPVIHRDIKPGNVISRPDGSFALVDFGSVRDHLKPEGGSTVVGTFGYMAPEQFQGRALPQSDVYAVGATALSLLTGREPEDLPHQGLGIDVAAALGSGADPRLVQVLSQMLEPDPDRRPARIAPLLGPRRGARRPRPERLRFVDRLLDNPLLVSALLIALFVFGVVLWAAFQVLLPLLLTLFSIVLGAPARRAARRSREAAKRSRAALKRARRALRDRSRSAAAAHVRVSQPQLRVPGPRLRVDDWQEPEEDEEAEPVRRRAEARR